MDRRNHQIERLLRRNYSKYGVMGKLSNMRIHWTDPRHAEDEDIFKNEINRIFNMLFSEGGYKIGKTKGYPQSEFLIKIK